MSFLTSDTVTAKSVLVSSLAAEVDAHIATQTTLSDTSDRAIPEKFIDGLRQLTFYRQLIGTSETELGSEIWDNVEILYFQQCDWSSSNALPDIPANATNLIFF